MALTYEQALQIAAANAPSTGYTPAQIDEWAKWAASDPDVQYSPNPAQQMQNAMVVSQQSAGEQPTSSLQPIDLSGGYSSAGYDYGTYETSSPATGGITYDQARKYVESAAPVSGYTPEQIDEWARWAISNPDVIYSPDPMQQIINAMVTSQKAAGETPTMQITPIQQPTTATGTGTATPTSTGVATADPTRVTQLYYELLGRAPDPEGLAFWTSQPAYNLESSFYKSAVPEIKREQARQLAKIPINTAIPKPVIGQASPESRGQSIDIPGQYVTTNGVTKPLTMDISTMPRQQQDLTSFIVGKLPQPSITAPSMFSPENVRNQLELERLKAMNAQPTTDQGTPAAGFAMGGPVMSDTDKLLQNQRRSIMRESQSRQMLNTMGAPPVKKFSDGGSVEPSGEGSQQANQGVLPAWLRDPLDVGLDLANTALRGTAAAVVGPPYGVYKSLTSGKYGTPEGVRIGEQAATDLMATITGKPKTQEARDIMDFVGQKVEEAKIPMMPQFLTMPLPGPGSARAALQAFDMDKPPTGAVTIRAPSPETSLYHVTLSSNVPNIQKRGLNPLGSGRSNWVKQGTNERYQEAPAVFAFDDPRDALRWAAKMEYEFNSPISIIETKKTGNWVDDPSEDYNLAQFGKSLKTGDVVSPENISKVIDFSGIPKPAKLNMNFNDWLTQQGDLLRKAVMPAPPAPTALPLDSLGMSSRLSEAVSKLQNKGTGEQLLAQLNKAQGVPQAEIKATGLDEFLKSAGKVTRDDIQGYLEKNRVSLIEDERASAGAPIDELSIGTMREEFPYLSGDFFKRRYQNKDQVREVAVDALKAEGDELYQGFIHGDIRSFMDRDGHNVGLDGLNDWFRRERDWLYQYIDDIALEDSSVKHDQLSLPGGNNYREVLFKLPQKEGEPFFTPPLSHYRNAENTLGSIRMTDRVVDGKPILFAEEVQSDWAIKGARGGYRPKFNELPQGYEVERYSSHEGLRDQWRVRWNGNRLERPSESMVLAYGPTKEDAIHRALQELNASGLQAPDNPFRNNWYQPVMNRFLIKAAQEGKEGIGLTNGEVHIQRYNLRNYTEKVAYNPRTKLFAIFDKAYDDEPKKLYQNIDEPRLREIIGDETAEKLLGSGSRTDSAMGDDVFVLSGEELRIGGEGKNAFYDKILPDYLNKLGKKYGVQVEKRSLDPFTTQQKRLVNYLGALPDEKAREIHYFPITEEMRNDLLGKGLPTFAQGGEVMGDDLTNEEFIQEAMTGTPMSDTTTQPGILPPELRKVVDVPLDAANMALRGIAAGVAGPAYGLYKGVTSGKYGTQEGVKIGESEAARMMAKIAGEPKTQEVRDVMDFVGEKLREYKLDAPMPQLLTLPAPGAGSGEFIKQSLEKEFRRPPVGAVTLKPTPETDLGIQKLSGGLVFPEDETAERLRLKVQRKQAFEEKGKAMPGAPKNARTVIKAPKGSDLPDFVVGDIKPQDWIARTETLLNPDEIQQYGRWYDDVRGTFLKYTDGDENLTDKYMRAWLVANQNIGVEGAFNNVLLQAEQFARGVPKDQMRAAGLPFATQAARNALQDEPITEGVGLKIADFVDSAEGKTTRSIYGNDAQAGAPFVVDIHTARDTGLVDDILLNHLERAGYKVDRNKIKTDLAMGPTDTQYENRSDFGRSLTQYLNDNNWQGRNDWTPKEIQAIGWMAMTKLTRDASDDTVTALERSLRRLSMEFSPGEGSPWAARFGERFNALDPEGQRELTQVATSQAVDMARQVSGIDLRGIVHGSGGWQKFQNPAAVAQTLATREGSEIAANALGYILNQTEVWSNAVKSMTKNPKAFAIDFIQLKGDDLSTDQGIMGFWEKVMEADPTGLFVGYQPIKTVDNQPGIRVIVDKGGAKRMQDIQAALEGPIAKMIKDSPLDIDAKGYENELVKAVNNWKENPNGQVYLARLADLGIGDPATRLDPLRGQLEAAIESWFENRADAAKPGSGTKAASEATQAAQGVAPEIGINVASDTKAGAKYADLIVDGQKTLESRDTDSLRPYVGKRVAIVRTGEGQAKAIGAATIGEPIVADAKQFRELQGQHLVPEGSKFDIKGDTKYLYPIIDPERFDVEQEVGKGIVARRVRAKGTTSAAEDLAAVSPTAPAVSRIDMNFKDVTKRVPELTAAGKKLYANEITWKDYDELVNKYKPITPYDFVPAPSSYEDAIGALMKNQAGRFSVIQEGIPEGKFVELRLDIPAYRTKGVWVNSIHSPGDQVLYSSVSSIKDVTFILPDDTTPLRKAGEYAAEIKDKSPFARMGGKWQPLSEKEAVSLSQKYLNDPEWAQVGYDPERHSYFYDRATTEPVIGADEVIQIGPLVLAKNVKYANKSAFPYKDGGEITAFIKAKGR